MAGVFAVGEIRFGSESLLRLLQEQLLDLQGRIITSRHWESGSPLVLVGLDLPAGVCFLSLRQMSNGVMRMMKVVCR